MNALLYGRPWLHEQIKKPFCIWTGSSNFIVDDDDDDDDDIDYSDVEEVEDGDLEGEDHEIKIEEPVILIEECSSDDEQDSNEGVAGAATTSVQPSVSGTDKTAAGIFGSSCHPQNHLHPSMTDT